MHRSKHVITGSDGTWVPCAILSDMVEGSRVYKAINGCTLLSMCYFQDGLEAVWKIDSLIDSKPPLYT